MLDYSLYPTDEQLPTEGLVLKRARAKVASPGGVLSNTVQPGQGSALPNALDSYRTKAASLYQQGTELMNQDVDTSALQQFAQQRGQQGEQAMLNALAAQYAGEQFQPMQEQFLKTAAASKDPMKVGGGMITTDGQYIKDPFASQDKRVELLLQQAKAYEQMALTADTARERILAQRKHDEMMGELRMMGLNMQREGLQLRRDALNQRQGDDSKNWRNEDALRKDFDTLTKDLRDELNATSKITQIVSATPPGQKPDAITQQSLVILLNKFLDPGSVVREGEFDRVVKAQGLEGQAKNLADRILKGQPLDANTIGQINGLAKLYQQAATSKIQTIANNYTEIANKRKLDAGSVISDPRFRSGSAPTGNAPPGVDPNVWKYMTPEERALWN